MLQVFFFLCLLEGLRSHSWVSCTRYDGEVTGFQSDYDNNRCNGYIRQWANYGGGAPSQFGQDRGVNYQPSGNQICDRDSGYTDAYPKATYAVGDTIRVVWPAKNHVADTCTNQFIPDNSMKLYRWTGDGDAVGSSPLENDDQYELVIDWQANGGPGFQNCPQFCANTDKAVCYGDFEVPSIANGDHTFIWEWEFNQGSFYTSCWEATVGGAGTSPTRSPTEDSTPSPTSATSSVSMEIQVTISGGTFNQNDVQQALSSVSGISRSSFSLTAFNAEGSVGTAVFIVSVNAGNVASLTTTFESSATENQIQASSGGVVQVEVLDTFDGDKISITSIETFISVVIELTITSPDVTFLEIITAVEEAVDDFNFEYADKAVQLEDQDGDEYVVKISVTMKSLSDAQTLEESATSTFATRVASGLEISAEAVEVESSSVVDSSSAHRAQNYTLFVLSASFFFFVFSLYK